MDLSFNAVSLVVSLIVGVYFVDRSLTPPNPAPAATIEYGSDSVQPIHRIDFLRPWTRLLALLHFALILFPNHRANFCLNPDLLKPALYRWSPYTVLYIATIVAAGSGRLLAYSQLGKNFTFRLAKPSGLVTSGMYAYVQHPSYTNLLLVVAANSFVTLRLDGSLACILPSWIVIPQLSLVFGLGVLAVCLMSLTLRVRDEEQMMKKEFGLEWEEWSRKTAKFIPFIF